MIFLGAGISNISGKPNFFFRVIKREKLKQNFLDRKMTIK